LAGLPGLGGAYAVPTSRMIDAAALTYLRAVPVLLAAVALLALLAPGPASAKGSIKQDLGWARIWQNKSWAYMLDGMQGGILSVALGSRPLDLAKGGSNDAASAWVRIQIHKQPGWGGHFSLEVHEPGEWALLKSNNPAPGPVPGKPARPYLFGVEIRHVASARDRLAELRQGKCDIAQLPLSLMERALAIPGVHLASIQPSAKAAPLILAYGNQVRCVCSPLPCFLDLSYVWTKKSHFTP
jgi:ABC-type transport system substrate-binding protein